jgi:hypothetical protein
MVRIKLPEKTELEGFARKPLRPRRANTPAHTFTALRLSPSARATAASLNPWCSQ